MRRKTPIITIFASQQMRNKFHEAIDRGRLLDPAFTNFNVEPDAQLLAALSQCPAMVPESVAGALVIPRASTYAQAVHELERWLASQKIASQVQ